MMLQKVDPIVRRPTELLLDQKMIADAKELNIDAAAIAEASIAKAVRDERTRLWKIENREAIESWNDYIEEHGLPLEEFRQF